MRVAGCPLCDGPAADSAVAVAETGALRVVRVLDAADFPAYYRVVWKRHAAEFSDLDAKERALCMEAVVAVERALRELSPTKINLAALGNMVPHLHWHVIARFEWDSHFPHPIWGPRQRDPAPRECERLSRMIDSVDKKIQSVVVAPSR